MAEPKGSISTMVSELWWLWVIQAIVSILFGALAVFWPGLTLVTFVYLLSVFVVVVGVVEVVRALVSVKTRPDTWWMSLIVGFLTLGVGMYLARHPGLTLKTFILVVGITLVAWGVIDLARTFFEEQSDSHRVLSFVSGVVGVGVGIFTLLQPKTGGIAFVWAFGLFALVYGISALVMAIEHHRSYQAFKALVK